MKAQFSSSVRISESYISFWLGIWEEVQMSAQLAERLCGVGRYLNLKQETQPIVLYVSETRTKSHVRLTPAKLG
jgi:hypothetical protein